MNNVSLSHISRQHLKSDVHLAGVILHVDMKILNLCQ